MVSILRWIWNNKYWLFSGAGFIILGIIYRFIFPRFRKQKPSVLSSGGQSLAVALEGLPAEVPQAKTDLKPISLSPREIREKINEVPLLQRPALIKHYVGLPVRWEGKLASAREMSKDKIHIMISVKEKDVFPSEAVFVDIKRSDYPGIGLLKTEHPIRVSGVISRIEEYFYLKDARIDYELGSEVK